MFWKRKKRIKAQVLSSKDINQIIEQNNLVFVFFSAPWCGACKILKPLVDELADENREKDLFVGSVNIDNEPVLAWNYQIRSIPYLCIFKNKNIVYSGTGMISKPRIQEMIDSFLI